jgi:hypothetical protein
MKRKYDFSRAKRGPVISVPKGKTRITIRLDDDILGWFREQVDRAGGGNYQTLINEALWQHIRRVREPLETTLRRVLREELRHDPPVYPKLAPVLKRHRAAQLLDEERGSR